MVLACSLVTLSGCVTTSPLDWLRDEHANAIAADLVIAVAERVPPVESPIYVDAMPLRDHFENAIREHGYAIANEPDDAITIGGIGERIPPNTWHVGLSIDDGMRIHRLYHVKQDDVHALSSISVVNAPHREADEIEVVSDRWHLRTLSKPERTTAVATRTVPPDEETPYIPQSPTGPFLPVAKNSAPAPVAANVSDCPSRDGAVLTLNPGSLQQSIANFLDHCGWTLASWPSDPNHAGYIVDWIIEHPITFNAESVNAFLDRIEQSYGVITERDHILKTVDVSLAE